MEIANLEKLTTLGHPWRMSVFRLLMRRYPQAVPAGEIGAVLNIKPSTLSVYLSGLQNVGLVAVERRGTSRLFRIEMREVEALHRFLFQECCRGRPDLCLPNCASVKQGTDGAEHIYNVLFLCTGNSARSVIAEALLRDQSKGRFNAFSAGTQPRDMVNPVVIEMLLDKGHDITELRSKHIREFDGPDAPEFDFVFTVCDRAANEECPAWAGQPISAHWGMPDPTMVAGTDAERRLAFQHTYGALRNRIRAFADLPLQTLTRVSLQAALDDLATELSPEGV